MGARPNMDGIDGIQCHMTNTLNTPIEAIERDYPLRVMQYEFAEHTGGAGRYCGGNGLVRALQLSEGSARLSLVAERHARAPHGAQGGSDGTTGAHYLLTKTGTRSRVPAKTTVALEPGETIFVQTPGGGGYGLGVGVAVGSGAEGTAGEAGTGDAGATGDGLGGT
jgi:N-methylhydantoinase B